ncbi:MAG TPA: peptide deformylase [Terriglobia bacterium]|nr:peptide deformylase [Terriglobia bacterium]
MLLKLFQAGEPVLRQKARELTPKEIRSPEIRRLIREMHETLRDAPGVGLAAPQIGLGIQLAIIEDLSDYGQNLTAEQMAERQRESVPFHVIINPQLTPIGEPDAAFFEGCLSLTGFTALVPRYRRVRVECLDENAEKRTLEGKGWYARILQHEIDHLHGNLYIDRMIARSFMSVENFNRKWRDLSIDEVKARLRQGHTDSPSPQAT